MKKLISAAIIFVAFFGLLVTKPISPKHSYTQSVNSNLGLTNIGYAAFNLTAPNFNCSGFLEATKNLEELHISFLYNTFGNKYACLKTLLKDPRLKTLESTLIS